MNEKKVRPTLKKLPEDTNSEEFLEILSDYEEGIIAGLSKDRAAAFACINEPDHLRLLAVQIAKDPEWLNDLQVVGKENMKANAQVNIARKIRSGEASMSLFVLERLDAETWKERKSMDITSKGERLTLTQMTDEQLAELAGGTGGAGQA